MPDHPQYPVLTDGRGPGRGSPPANSPTPPHSLEAEREVLASPLVQSDVIAQIRDTLSPDDFYIERHQIIYTAMLAMHDRRIPIDPVLLVAEIRSMGKFERVGGVRAVGELLERAGTTNNVEHYAAIVLEKAALRRLITAARTIEVSAYGNIDSTHAFFEDCEKQISEALRQKDTIDPRRRLLDWRYWTADKFTGEAPPVEWVVPEILARSEVALFAAPGDSGKGFMSLNLAMQIASGLYFTGPRAPFGRPLMPSEPPGSAVIFTAEDSWGAVHRRIAALDPDGTIRAACGSRLVVIPMPSAKGHNTFPLLERGEGDALYPSAKWMRYVSEMADMEDLRLVVLDPLASFVPFDVNADPAVGAALTTELARSAEFLSAAFLVCHHMRKMGEKDGVALPTHESARDRIRGTSALVDGVRMAYALVPLPPKFAKAVLQKLNLRGEYDSARVYWGAVVKANGRADRRPRIFVRADSGLLEDRTTDILPAMGNKSVADVLADISK